MRRRVIAVHFLMAFIAPSLGSAAANSHQPHARTLFTSPQAIVSAVRYRDLLCTATATEITCRTHATANTASGDWSWRAAPNQRIIRIDLASCVTREMPDLFVSMMREERVSSAWFANLSRTPTAENLAWWFRADATTSLSSDRSGVWMQRAGGAHGARGPIYAARCEGGHLTPGVEISLPRHASLYHASRVLPHSVGTQRTSDAVNERVSLITHDGRAQWYVANAGRWHRDASIASVRALSVYPLPTRSAPIPGGMETEPTWLPLPLWSDGVQWWGAMNRAVLSNVVGRERYVSDWRLISGTIDAAATLIGAGESDLQGAGAFVEFRPESAGALVVMQRGWEQPFAGGGHASQVVFFAFTETPGTTKPQPDSK